MVQRILTQRSWNTDLAQVVQQDPDTVVQKDPTEILQKWSYRKWSYKILIKRSCASVLITGILYKCFWRILIQVVQRIPTQRSWARSCTSATTYRDLAQVVPQDPDTSGPKDPDTEILHKWSHRIPTPEILYKWSYKILIQVVQNDPHTEIHRILIQVVQKDKDPETEILHKWPYRILIERSCTSGLTGSS